MTERTTGSPQAGHVTMSSSSKSAVAKSDMKAEYPNRGLA